MTQEEAVAAAATTKLTRDQQAQALCNAGICKTMDEAKEAVNSYAQSTNATAAANATAVASETTKSAATDASTAANTAQAASETVKQASVDGTTAANAAETLSEEAKNASGLEGFAANVAEAGSEVTKQAAVDGTTVANAAEAASEEAKNASGLEGMATNIAEAASEATEAAATDASAVANAAEAVTEQAKAAAGAESTVVNEAQAASEGAAAAAARDHAKANLEEAASEGAKQGVQKKGIQVTSKLGTALKNKYTWIIAGVAAVTAGIVALYKHLNPSKETLGKNLDEAKQKVQESTQKIEEMENELTNVRDRIAELKGMGSLTIVQQKELDNLEKSSSQLERNIELEKEYRRLKKKDANKAFVDWFNKDMKDKTEYTYSTADKSDGANSGFRKIANFLAPVIDAKMKTEQNNGAPTIAELNGEQGAHLVFSSDDETFEIENQFEQAKKLIAQKNQEITLEQKEQIDSQLEEIEKHFLDKTKELEEALGDKEAELTWTPNAVAGTDEAEVNDIIAYMDELRDQATLLKGEIHNDISGAYEDVVNANLKSSRFSEAAKEIEKLKTAEDGTTRTSKQFRKALYEAITKSPDGSNIKELANYLEELGMIKVDPEIGVDGIADFSNAIVESIDETDKATQSNLLFADSFSKIASARKAFEEGLSSVETGTEDFASYADSYEKAMELLNKGYDLDNGVLMAHVERLISDKQLKKLGYDADKVKAYLQEHLKGVFGDKDTDAPGNGLIDKIEKSADENGKIYAKDKNGNIDKTRELASYKDGNWHISDDTKDIEALGKEFGMTTDQILSCIKAMKTFSDVDLNDTETIINQLKEENKVFSVTDKKSKKSAVNISQVESDMEASGQYSSKDIFDTIQQLKDDKNVITVEIDAKSKSSKVAGELEKLGILSGNKTEGIGRNQFEYREINNIDKATEALKTFGLTGQEAYDKIKDISIKDQTGQIVSDAKKLESVLKEFSDFDIKDFTTIWKTDNGKWVENVINVKSLRDTLAEQGWESSTIDAYIQGLKKEAEKSSNKIVIDTDIDFEKDTSALTSVEEMLAKAGVAKKDGDVYTVDVEQTIKLLQSNNASSDDATAFLQNLQAQADKANSSLKLEFTTNASTIEGAISNVYTGAAEVKNNIDAANVSLDTYNNKDLSGIREQLGTTADEAYRNATGLSSANNEADKLNGREIIYSVIKNEITNTGGTGDANGTANISGTALAGGNWGTAPGGKTLTGELG